MTKVSSDIAKHPWGAKSPEIENHRFNISRFICSLYCQRACMLFPHLVLFSQFSWMSILVSTLQKFLSGEEMLVLRYVTPEIYILTAGLFPKKLYWFTLLCYVECLLIHIFSNPHIDWQYLQMPIEWSQNIILLWSWFAFSWLLLRLNISSWAYWFCVFPPLQNICLYFCL